MNREPNAMPHAKTKATNDPQTYLARYRWSGETSEVKKTTDDIDKAQIERPILDKVKNELFLFSMYFSKLRNVCSM